MKVNDIFFFQFQGALFFMAHVNILSAAFLYKSMKMWANERAEVLNFKRNSNFSVETSSSEMY
jgi:hypothetical protein